VAVGCRTERELRTCGDGGLHFEAIESVLRTADGETTVGVGRDDLAGSKEFDLVEPQPLTAAFIGGRYPR